MMKICKKVLLALVGVLLLASAAMADVQHAFSARPAESFYVTGQVGDLGGTLQKIFSQTNVDMFASMIPSGEADQFRLIAAIASQIPAKSVGFVFGFENMRFETPFFQLAVSVPEDVAPELGRLAIGEASPMDIVTLFVGKAGLPLSMALSGTYSVEKGSKGPYYNFTYAGSSLILAARDNLLLIALSPGDLEASITALENAEYRLVVKRRFDVPDYCFVHMDESTLATLSKLIIGGEATNALLSSPDFKTPLVIEVAFEPQQFTVYSNADLVLPLMFPLMLPVASITAAMVLSSGSATESAESSNVISDLRSMKVACLIFYADHIEEIHKGTMALDIKRIAKFTDDPSKFESLPYLVVEEGGRWWVGYDLKAAGKSRGVKERLRSRAQSVGLMGARSLDSPYTSQDVVWMMAR